MAMDNRNIITLANQATRIRRQLLLFFSECGCIDIHDAEQYIQKGTLRPDTLQAITTANLGLMKGESLFPESLIQAAQDKLANASSK